SIHKQSDANLFIELGQRIIEAPSLDRVNLMSDKWITHADQLRQLLELGRKNADIRTKWNDQLIPASWDQDALEARQAIIQYQGKWWGFVSGTYRSARTKVKAWYRSPERKNLDYLATVDAILDAQHIQRSIHTHDGLARELFNGYWSGMSTDWESVARL